MSLASKVILTERDLTDLAARSFRNLFREQRLDVIYEDFCFYWKRNTTILGNAAQHRLRGGNLAYGTIGGADKEIPIILTERMMFFLFRLQKNQIKSFCHAYSPANNTRFGVYGAIPNGTGFKVNYDVVSIPDGTDNKQAFVLTLRRLKIVGDQDNNFNIGDEDRLVDIRKQRQKGRGRMYSPRMGLLRLERKSSDNSKISVDVTYSGKQFQEVEVAKDDVVLFIIEPSSIDKGIYQRSNNRGGENVDDINQTVKAEQEAADDTMQIGEHFAIGNTKWVVEGRSDDPFNPDGNDRTIVRMRCIDTLSLGKS